MDITKDTRAQFEQVIKVFEQGLKTIHTGLAHAGLVEDIKVNQYNSQMPLKQLATVSTPAPNEIIIRPWDAGSLQPIETALAEQGRNFNPANDGAVIRINLPPLSAERRQELAKLVSRQGEEAKVGLRTYRAQTWREVVQKAKSGALTEDDQDRLEQELNKLIRDFNSRIDDLTDLKQKAIVG